MSGRRILHVDMDAFFASVEERDDPSLRDRPIIVGGHNTTRGVVAAASYTARAFGVKAAMPLWEAHQLCPQAVYLPVRMRRYAEVSRQFHAIFDDYTPLVEPLGFDEAFLDVSGSEHLFGPAKSIARAIQDRIQDELGLSCSVGASYNKFLAKIASGWKKPHGLFCIFEDNALAFLDALPLEELPGVGYRTRERLERLGLRTVHDVKALSPPLLQSELGRLGADLVAFSQGIDPRPVVPASERKSMGEEATFEQDISDPEEMKRILLAMCDRLARQLRKEGFRARRVSLKARFPDFHGLVRAHSLKEATDSADVLFETIKGLFAQSKIPRVRLLGVQLGSLERGDQSSLFSQQEDARRDALGSALDKIQTKYGDGAIGRAAHGNSGPKDRRTDD